MEGNSQFESFEMQISQSAQGFLRTAAAWAMFLSIVGFLCIALGFLGSFGIMAAGSALKSMPGAAGMMSGMGGGLTLLFLMVLMFLPVLFLFKFSISTRKALDENNTERITKAFANLKSYFMWYGIVTIISIIGYIVLIIAMISMAASMGSNM